MVGLTAASILRAHGRRVAVIEARSMGRRPPAAHRPRSRRSTV
ncbi:MAG: hypothetical protein EXR66_09735 [Dehalococcoidia bacterium]|nr:hypothetical protein [Dehalococcoidia bacterium]